MSPQTLTLSIHCHCRTSTHTFTLPTSLLPLPSNLCNCDISRRISGSLLTSYVPITHRTPSNPQPAKPNLESLICYSSSGILNRWFCATCGTHMYLEYLSSGDFWAATGTLDSSIREESEVGDEQELIKYDSCMWIEDTLDGGASDFIQKISGRQLARWKQEAVCSEKVAFPWPLKTLASSSRTNPAAAATKKPIYAHCHCRGVEFWITSPSDKSREPTTTQSAWPDLLIPHHESKNKSPNSTSHAWWLPNQGQRYLAGTCTCTSCRQVSGFDITFWAFIPTCDMFLDSALTQPLPSSSVAEFGSMKLYPSSPGVTRSFCSVCGANIFWQGSEEKHGRKGLLDVAVGLLDAPSGARAEEILAWWPGRVSFKEEAGNKALVRGLEDGLKEWGERNSGREWVARFDEGILDGSLV